MVAFLLAGCTHDGAVRLPVPPSLTPVFPPSPTPPPPLLEQGNGIFSRIAGGGTGISGAAGTLVTYCVLMEDGIVAFTVDEFAAVVDAVLADQRGWIASKRWRFARAPSCAVAGLRIHLTTPATTDRLCVPAAQTEGQYSCRNGDNIFINLRRWAIGVPHYGDALDTYRYMLINHEVGHYLGFGHVTCPRPGRPAPVMQTQTIALDGCVINPYPYPDGVNYVG